LGLKNGSSQEIGLVDLAMNIVAFETINNVRIRLELTVVDRRGRGDVQVTATAHPRTPEVPVPPPLASVSVTCLATNLRTVDAALIHVLYLLDGRLAKVELGGE